MDNKELLRRIAQIDRAHEETMQDNPTIFTFHTLPFYQRFKLLLVSVKLPHRPLEFRYADDGSELFIFGAAPEHIYQVNQREKLQLSIAQVGAYVRFFFENVREPQATIVERPEEVKWLGSEQPDFESLKKHAKTLIHPVMITQTSTKNYSVIATAIASKELIEFRLAISSEGRVNVESRQSLLKDLPIPQVIH